MEQKRRTATPERRIEITGRKNRVRKAAVGIGVSNRVNDTVKYILEGIVKLLYLLKSRKLKPVKSFMCLLLAVALLASSLIPALPAPTALADEPGANILVVNYNSGTELKAVVAGNLVPYAAERVYTQSEIEERFSFDTYLYSTNNNSGFRHTYTVYGVKMEDLFADALADPSFTFAGLPSGASLGFNSVDGSGVSIDLDTPRYTYVDPNDLSNRENLLAFILGTVASGIEVPAVLGFLESASPDLTTSNYQYVDIPTTATDGSSGMPRSYFGQATPTDNNQSRFWKDTYRLNLNNSNLETKEAVFELYSVMCDRATILSGPLSNGEKVLGAFTGDNNETVYIEGTSVKSLLPTGANKVTFNTADGEVNLTAAEIAAGDYTLVYATATDADYSDRVVIERAVGGKTYYFDLYRNGEAVLPNVSGIYETPVRVERDAPTGVSGGVGAIIGSTAAMEYRLDGETNWMQCASPETVVGAGDYYVRYMETKQYYASPEVGPLTVTALPTTAGGGTEDNPYLIADMNDLRWMAEKVNALEDDEGNLYTATYLNPFRSAYYELTSDIVYDDAGFTPIGGASAATGFAGYFDGKGHAISGLIINETGYYGGLFCYINEATVKNLSLPDISVTAAYYVGGVAGNSSGANLIENCNVTGSLTSTYVSGVAPASANTVIRNCYFSGSANGSSYAGGIAYNTAAGAVIENCYSAANIIGGMYAGGIVCVAAGVSIRNCYSTGVVGSVSTGQAYVGGIAGNVYNNAVIENCYSTAVITTNGIGRNAYVGGIAGQSGSATFRNNVALSPSITGDADSIGRLMGNVSVESINKNNYVWTDMLLNGVTVADNGMGFSAEFFNVAAGWPAAFKTEPWVYEEGRMPVLAGLDGQEDAMPTHLTLAGPPPSIYSVTFDFNYETAESAMTPVLAGTAISKPADPVRGDYEFLGWRLDGEEYNFETAVTGDITLVAAWEVWSDELGSGTIDAPYIIDSLKRLNWMSGVVNDPSTRSAYKGAYYELTEDIVYEGDGFTPIGGVSSMYMTTIAFAGVFDGKGHTISGLTVNPTAVYAGLFATINTGGQVRNLGLLDVSISADSRNGSNYGVTDSYAGGIVGISNGVIENCYVTGSVNGSGFTYVGGIAGSIGANARIRNCYTAGSVSGDDFAGGIAGYAAMQGGIENCYSTAAVATTGTFGDNGSASSNGLGGTAGGVLGTAFQQNGGFQSIQDNVALNPTVDGGVGGGAYRVAAGSGTRIRNNNTWEGMLVDGVTVASNSDTNGAGYSAEAINTAEAWPAAFQTAPWQYTEGQLPILSDLNGQDGSMPTWLSLTVGPTYYTVTFDYNDGVTDNATVSVEAGLAVAKPADPARDGYDFAGWFLGEAEYGFETAITGDVTLTAKWEEAVIPPTYYTVTFVYNDGVTDACEVDVEEGTTVTQPEDPVREGYEFLGWYLNDAGFDFTVVITGDVALVAQWGEITGPDPVFVVSAEPSAYVTKLNGNTNDLTITVTEALSDGTGNTITVTFSISNNAAGYYSVGLYNVYVDTKGNDQIREIYIVQ